LNFCAARDRWLCELVDHGRWGIEAQFWRNEEFDFSRRFDHSEHDGALARDLASAWARETRSGIEKDGGSRERKG
jgi:hypothetical protein